MRKSQFMILWKESDNKIFLVEISMVFMEHIFVLNIQHKLFILESFI